MAGGKRYPEKSGSIDKGKRSGEVGAGSGASGGAAGVGGAVERPSVREGIRR